ncbi:hypothetical protein L0Y97_29135 (plasmid) [Burkholderia multivorans]|uniref:hypothetical protein n=1 Tax=Burkholderia multivorans TaxID=87883 RepID=UPI0020197CF6|nr:hypothetical protein [Burkholderia multivorans]MCO1362883.1 hypothetical protein [Burkholderia multivorans]MCO1422768.1 hypothetical protein [Burkholderia multivorans]UQO98747.1 hypothetical protein L0Z41_29100 [Burkholderia multivorans]
MSEILTEAEESSIRAVAAGDKAQIEAARAAFNRAAPEHGVARALSCNSWPKYSRPFRICCFARSIVRPC